MLFAIAGRAYVCDKSSVRVEAEQNFREKQKKVYLKYDSSKWRSRDDTVLLLGECHITNRDASNAEMFNAFFASVFSTNDGLWDHQRLEFEDCDCANNKLLANSELVCNLLLQQDAYKSINLWGPMGFIPGYSKT